MLTPSRRGLKIFNSSFYLIVNLHNITWQIGD